MVSSIIAKLAFHIQTAVVYFSHKEFNAAAAELMAAEILTSTELTPSALSGEITSLLGTLVNKIKAKANSGSSPILNPQMKIGEGKVDVSPISSQGGLNGLPWNQLISAIEGLKPKEKGGAFPDQLDATKQNNEGNIPIEPLQVQFRKEKKKLKINDIIAPDRLKTEFTSTFINPFIYTSYFKAIDRETSNMLMYGIPGTGKTTFMKALTNTLDVERRSDEGVEELKKNQALFDGNGVNFVERYFPKGDVPRFLIFAAELSYIKSMWSGEGGRRIRRYFQMANECAPSILFFDEVDQILSNAQGSHNDDTISTFKNVVSGVVSKKFSLVVATNYPSKLEAAVLSRFTTSIEIPAPDFKGRCRIFQNIISSASPVTSEPNYFYGEDVDQDENVNDMNGDDNNSKKRTKGDERVFNLSVYFASRTVCRSEEATSPLWTGRDIENFCKELLARTSQKNFKPDSKLISCEEIGKIREATTFNNFEKRLSEACNKKENMQNYFVLTHEQYEHERQTSELTNIQTKSFDELNNDENSKAFILPWFITREDIEETLEDYQPATTKESVASQFLYNLSKMKAVRADPEYEGEKASAWFGWLNGVLSPSEEDQIRKNNIANTTITFPQDYMEIRGRPFGMEYADSVDSLGDLRESANINANKN